MRKRRFHTRLISAVVPISFTLGCALESLFPETVATGAARLSVQNMGVLLQYVADIDKTCGLSSVKPEIIDGTTAVYSVTNCLLDFGQKTKISQDCLGNETFASGRVRLNAKQIRKGIRTSHDGHYAVIPWPNNQVDFELDIQEFSNYKLWVSNRHESLNIVRGKALAKMAVNLSHDPSTGFCTVPTPELTVRQIQYQDAVLELPGPFGKFRVPVQASDFVAQAGAIGDHVNHLSGHMTVWGEQARVPKDNKGLDPDYDQDAHLKSFQCNLKPETPLPNYQCDAKRELAVHAARLLVLNTAMVVKEAFAEKKTQEVGVFSWLSIGCGFDSLLQKWGTCKDGLHRLIQIADCSIGINHDLPEFYEKDCASEHLYMLGRAQILAGSLRVDESCTFTASERKRPDSITFFLDSVRLSNFGAYYLSHGHLSPIGKLLIREGHLSAKVQPIFAENKQKGQFDVATPVEIIEQLNLTEADTELWLNPGQVEGGDFMVPMVINGTALFAQNGLFRGAGNHLNGEIIANGERFIIGDVRLNPDFNAEAFDLSYACDPDLKQPIPSH